MINDAELIIVRKPTLMIIAGERIMDTVAVEYLPCFPVKLEYPGAFHPKVKKEVDRLADGLVLYYIAFGIILEDNNDPR